jgi:hypothetical protein
MSNDLATPETLEQLADAHSRNGDDLTARTFRSMAFSWRQTQRLLALTEAENSLLQGVVNKARHEASRLEELSIQVHNTLAGGYKAPPAANAEQVAA